MPLTLYPSVSVLCPFLLASLAIGAVERSIKYLLSPRYLLSHIRLKSHHDLVDRLFIVNNDLIKSMSKKELASTNGFYNDIPMRVRRYLLPFRTSGLDPPSKNVHSWP